MGNHFVCVELNPLAPKARIQAQAGSALAILLGAVVILGIVGVALFEIGNAGRNRSLTTEYRDRAVAGIEFNLEGIRQSVANQFAQRAWVDVSSLGGNQDQSSGSEETEYYNVDVQAQAQAPSNQIWATQSHNSFQFLSASDDPFRGGAAVVDTFTVTADAQSSISGSSDSRFALPTMTLTPQINVRQIPVSEFTLFSSADLQVVPPFMPIVGRVHSEGDLTIWGGTCISIYPVTAAGNISLANNGSLFAQAGPLQPEVSLPFESTANDAWLGMSRSVERSDILSGRDLPMTMVQGADINQLTAQGATGNAAIAQQQLWRQCSRIVYEANGTITVTTGSGVKANAQENRAFKRFVSPTNPGAPVIIFDLSKDPPSPARNSFYISSSNPNAIVLLTNAANLPADLAIVSPLAVSIAGGFNTQGVPKAASITAKTVSAVPTN